ncbi:unnamed protein product [Paramecium primaurelia]|uniref:Uncharacterized protein n=1 Tax=Paramecium primaurelia TaxID=5886 RepID=A0A8S1KTN0_PARPR|nr:unnamed protein product [Paramecium primaurelia]
MPESKFQFLCFLSYLSKQDNFYQSIPNCLKKIFIISNLLLCADINIIIVQDKNQKLSKYNISTFQTLLFQPHFYKKDINGIKQQQLSNDKFYAVKTHKKKHISHVLTPHSCSRFVLISFSQ